MTSLSATEATGVLATSPLHRPDALSWLTAALSALLFATMLFFQSTLQPVKLGLLLLVLAVLALEFGRRRFIVPLHRQVVSVALWMPCVGLAMLIHGLMRGNDGALPSSTVYVLWPMLFLILVASVTTPSRLSGGFRVLFLVTPMIGVYGMCFIGVQAGLLPSFFYVDLGLQADVGFYKGFIEVGLTSITTLMAGVPALLAACLLAPRRGGIVNAGPLVWLGTSVALLFSLLSGRRGLWLVIALAPLVIIALCAFLPRQELAAIARRNARVWIVALVLGIIIGIAGLSAIGIQFDVLVDQLVSAFDFSGEASARARRDQTIALLDEWREAPIIGQGLGAAARDSVRSAEMPWAYELSYLALLMQLGAAGFAIYVLAMGWIYLSGFRVISRGGAFALPMIVALAALTCFLIANATNPYLQTFDSIWVVFFPVAVLNAALLADAKLPAR